jgi:hypothetical protein
LAHKYWTQLVFYVVTNTPAYCTVTFYNTGPLRGLFTLFVYDLFMGPASFGRNAFGRLTFNLLTLVPHHIWPT